MTIMPIIRNGETFLSTSEACSFLNVSRQTVNKLVKDGRLHQNKQGIGRTVFYSKAELERLAAIRQIEREGQE